MRPLNPTIALGGADGNSELRHLLKTIETTLADYVVFRSHAQRAAVALWIAHTHPFDAFEVTPYLNVRSAEKRSGKTRLLEVIKELVPGAWHTVQPTEAVLFRKIARDTPTLLLDEVDAIFKGPPTDRTEGLRALLNAGYRRGATVDRCAGKDRDALKAFAVFCPKMLVGIGTLPDTVADRCIPVVLVRRKASEPVAHFKLRDFRPQAQAIRERLMIWAEGAVDQLREARPEMPEMGDRAAEVWEPLIAIADLAGAEWPRRARAAALELNGETIPDNSLNVTLLLAIHDAFHNADTDRLTTLDLLRALVGREGESWGVWWGKEVDQASSGETPRKPSMELARRVRGFDVQPRKLRFGDRTANGYERMDFEDAFARYLPAEGRNDGTTAVAQGFEAFRPTSGGNGVGTPETLAAERLCQRSDLPLQGELVNAGVLITCTSCGSDTSIAEACINCGTQDERKLLPTREVGEEG